MHKSSCVRQLQRDVLVFDAVCVAQGNGNPNILLAFVKAPRVVLKDGNAVCIGERMSIHSGLGLTLITI